MAHGGYRKPANPAPVSGIGKHSRRTDGGPGTTPKQAMRYIQGNEYGESKELNDLQRSAPLAAAPQPPTPSAVDVVELGAPTQRPNEPITYGAPFGDGPGPNPAWATPADNGPDVAAYAIRQAYAAYPSPVLQRLVQQLEDEGR